MNQQGNENNKSHKRKQSLENQIPKRTLLEQGETDGIGKERIGAGERDKKDMQKPQFDQNLVTQNDVGMMDEHDLLKNQVQENGMFQYGAPKEEQELQSYFRVSDFILQPGNSFLSDMRNALNDDQNRNFLYNERKCIEILQQNNYLFTLESYQCTMIMCCILLDVGINLIRQDKLYLAEKYLFRAKQITEPSSYNQLKSNEEIGQKQDNQNGYEGQEIIFEKDFRFQEARIEIVLNLCEIYKKQKKKLKKRIQHQENKLSHKSSIYSPLIPTLQANPMNAIEEEKEETEAANGNQKRINLDLENMNDFDESDEENNLDNQGENRIPLNFGDETKEREMVSEEIFEEFQKKNEDKMEKALSVLNEIQAKMTQEYVEAAQYDQKGFLCRFFSMKVQVLNEIMKQSENNQDNKNEQQMGEEEEEMSIEMLRCAEFVISTLEGIIQPLKQEQQSEDEQQNIVLLANILSYTWTKLGKYYRKRNEIEKAEQCYRNAYVKMENYINEGEDHLLLRDKFRSKYEKFVGKLAFDQIGDNSVIEFAQFEDDIKMQKNPTITSQIMQPPLKKNYLAHSGIKTEKISNPAGQFYVDPEYLNQLQNHHTTKSLNKHRHLKKASSTKHSQKNIYSYEDQDFLTTLGNGKSKENLKSKLEFYRQKILGSNSFYQPPQVMMEITPSEHFIPNLKNSSSPQSIHHYPSSNTHLNIQNAKWNEKSNSNALKLEQSSLMNLTPQNSTNIGVDSQRPSSSINFNTASKQLKRPSSSKSGTSQFQRAIGVKNQSYLSAKPHKESDQNEEGISLQQYSPRQSYQLQEHTLPPSQFEQSNQVEEKRNKQFQRPHIHSMRKIGFKQQKPLNFEDQISDNIAKYSSSLIKGNNSMSGSRSTLSTSNRQLGIFKRPSSSCSNLLFHSNPNSFTNRNNQSFLPLQNPQISIKSSNILASTLGNFNPPPQKSNQNQPSSTPFFIVVNKDQKKLSKKSDFILHEIDNMKNDIQTLATTFEINSQDKSNMNQNSQQGNYIQQQMMINLRPQLENEKVHARKKGGLANFEIRKKFGPSKAQIRITLPEDNIKQVQYDDKKTQLQPSFSSRMVDKGINYYSQALSFQQGNSSEPKKDGGSQRHLSSSEKIKNKETSHSTQQFQNIAQTPIKENYPAVHMSFVVTPPQVEGVGLLPLSSNPFQISKDREGEITNSKSPTSNASVFLRKIDSENFNSGSFDNLNSNKSAKHIESSRQMLLSAKQDEIPLSKQILLRKQLSTNLTEGVFKRQSTAIYDQFQLDLPPTQNKNEEEKKRNQHFTIPFIKKKFEYFSTMNQKDQYKKTETQSSFDEEDELNSHNQSNIKETYSYQEEDQLRRQEDNKQEVHAHEENQIGTNSEQLKSKERKSNFNIMPSKKSIKNLSQLSQLENKLAASQLSGNQQSDTNKSISFYQSIDNIQSLTNIQQPLLITEPSSALSDKIINHSTVSQFINYKSFQSQIIASNFPSEQNSKEKTVSFPSVKESKYLFVQNRIQELQFVPMYFYKAFQQFSLCQWNVNNISIQLENVLEDEIIEDRLQAKNSSYKSKGASTTANDKIKYDIRMAIFIESTITDEFKVNNPLIFTLKNQPLNFLDHLWPSDKNKIETKYELAILLLDRWIKDQDFNVVEEFYNIELSYSNVQVQFILRGDHSQEFKKLIGQKCNEAQKQLNNNLSCNQANDKLDSIRLFGTKLNFIINKIAKVVKCPQGDMIKIPSVQLDNAKLSLRSNNLQGLRIHQEKRRQLKNFICYYKKQDFNFSYLQQISTFFAAPESLSSEEINNYSQFDNSQQDVEKNYQEGDPQSKKFIEESQPQFHTFGNQDSFYLKSKILRDENFPAYNEQGKNTIIQGSQVYQSTGSGNSHSQNTIGQQQQQKYSNLKLKMKERVIEIKKESDPMPLEMHPFQIKTELNQNRSNSINLNNISKESSSPSFNNASPIIGDIQISDKKRRSSYLNSISFGFSGAVELQQFQLTSSPKIHQQNMMGSPRNSSPFITWADSREDVNQVKQSDKQLEQYKIAEEYQKKNDQATLQGGQSSSLLSPLQPSQFFMRNSNLRVENLKRQIKDNTQQEDSPQSNSFNLSSNQSSPIHFMGGSFGNSLQRVPSALSNKSQKSIFSRFALQVMEEEEIFEENDEKKINTSIQQPPHQQIEEQAQSEQNTLDFVPQTTEVVIAPSKLYKLIQYFPPLEQQQIQNKNKFPLKYQFSFKKLTPQPINRENQNEQEELEEQQKEKKDEFCGDPFMDLPSYYKYDTFQLNSFENNTTLFKTIIKSNKSYFLVQIFFIYDQEVMQTISYPQAHIHSKFLLKFNSMVAKNELSIEIHLSFEEFIEKLIKQRTCFSFFKFLYKKGFSDKQKIAIKKGLEKDIQIKDSQLVFEWADTDLSKQEQRNLNNQVKHGAIIRKINQNAMNTFTYQKDLQKQIQLSNEKIEEEDYHQCFHFNNKQENNYETPIKEFLQIINRNMIKPSAQILDFNLQFKLPEQMKEKYSFLAQSNFDSKLFQAQKYMNFQSYETRTKKEDLISSFFLVYSQKIMVFLKYVHTENEYYHKISVYKPLSSNPLNIQIITQSNILDRVLNLKQLIPSIVVLDKKYAPTVRKTQQYHIYQGLESNQNLKSTLLNNLFQKKLNMNGITFKINQLFSSENKRVQNIINTNKVDRLLQQNKTILQGISKNLEQDIEANQARDIIQQTKYALLTFDVTDQWQFQQNEILFKNFERKTLSAYSYIEQRQKVFIMLTVFRSKSHLGFNQSVFLRLDIYPWNGQRNKLTKLVFDQSDISHLFDKQFSFDSCFNDKLLFKILDRIGKSLEYSKANIYKKFCIPLSKVNPSESDRHKFCLVNRYLIKVIQFVLQFSREIIYFEQPQGNFTPKEISKKSFLDLIQRGERVLFQGVKKIFNVYTIVRIGYYSQLDYFYFQIYFPFNCRKYTNTFYSSNLENLTREFLNSILKERIIIDHKEELSQCKDYNSFQKKYILFDPSKRSAIRHSAYESHKKNNLLIPNFTKLQNLTEESMDSSGELKFNFVEQDINQMPIFALLIENNSPFNVNKPPSYFELSIWEEIVRSVNIIVDPNGEMLMSMDNYSGVLREYLVKTIVHFSGNKNGLFEILIRFKDDKLKQDLLNSPEIPMVDSDNIKLDMYVRINFFEKENSLNEKIMLKQLFFTYYSNNKDKFKYIPKEQRSNNQLNQQINFNPSQQFLHGSKFDSNNIQNYSSQFNPNDNQIEYHFLEFHECTFSYSDLMNVAQLLLDRIRTNIQDKCPLTSQFEEQQNEQVNTSIKDATSQKIGSYILPSIHILELQLTEEKSVIETEKTIQQNIVEEHQLKDSKNIQQTDKQEKKKMKMNNNINISEHLDKEKKNLYMRTLYRGVFTVRPLQILAIFYCTKFYIQIYNTVNGKNHITELPFLTVEHQVPCLKQMLLLQLYQEIGKRIYLSFKNNLMIKSYPQLKNS